MKANVGICSIKLFKIKKHEIMKKRKVGSGGHNAKPVIYDGQYYNSRKEFGDKMNMSTSLVRYYIRTGNSLKRGEGNCIDEPF